VEGEAAEGKKKPRAAAETLIAGRERRANAGSK
jgi:hypothetical protein